MFKVLAIIIQDRQAYFFFSNLKISIIKINISIGKLYSKPFSMRSPILLSNFWFSPPPRVECPLISPHNWVSVTRTQPSRDTCLFPSAWDCPRFSTKNLRYQEPPTLTWGILSSWSSYQVLGLVRKCCLPVPDKKGLTQHGHSVEKEAARCSRGALDKSLQTRLPFQAVTSDQSCGLSLLTCKGKAAGWCNTFSPFLQEKRPPRIKRGGKKKRLAQPQRGCCMVSDKMSQWWEHVRAPSPSLPVGFGLERPRSPLIPLLCEQQARGWGCGVLN